VALRAAELADAVTTLRTIPPCPAPRPGASHPLNLALGLQAARGDRRGARHLVRLARAAGVLPAVLAHRASAAAGAGCGRAAAAGGASALECAAAHGHVALVRDLVACGAAAGGAGADAPLHAAAAAGEVLAPLPPPRPLQRGSAAPPRGRRSGASGCAGR
jgi:hypothetical protein